MLDLFLKFQQKFAILIVLLGLVATIFCGPSAIKLLTKISTDLAKLLPDDTPSVLVNKEVGQMFKSSANLFLIIYSKDPKANLKATIETKAFLEDLKEVDKVYSQKTGFNFFDDNKFILASLGDLYDVKDKLKKHIHKKKLGGLYIDFEEDEEVNGKKQSFEDLIESYKNRFSTAGVSSKYNTNKDQTVYVLSIHPTNSDSGLKFFKKFGEFIDVKVREFNLKRYGSGIEWGYAGGIKTRVDEYNILIQDLKTAAIFSSLTILLALFIYFRRIYSVFSIFVPLIYSTILNFSLCSLFFTHLNVITSFLFTIIMGLGVDIGIHLMSRTLQDLNRGIDFNQVHKNLIQKVGKSCAYGIFTTVATFYILVFTEFKGFTEFGWIAGNGLMIALLSYLLFLPSLIILGYRWGFLKASPKAVEKAAKKSKLANIPFAKPALILVLLLNVGALLTTNSLQFEWDFNNLKMKIPEREKMRAFVKEVQGGKVNSPAVYLVDDAIQARKIRQTIEARKLKAGTASTIDYVRSYYDLFPLDQEEKLAVLSEIDLLLDDTAIKGLDPKNRPMVLDFKKDIKTTKITSEKDVPENIANIFWGNQNKSKKSLVYISPLPHLHMNNGTNALAFHKEVAHVPAVGRDFHAVNSGIIFADVLITLFRDSKKAIILAILVLITLIFYNCRDVKLTFFIFLSLGSGIVMMLSFMTFMDLKINFYNMIIIPTVMGMGIDNSIHLVHRFEEEGRRTVMEALRTSGDAAFMASITTMLGYSGLLLTHHPGLFSLGSMAVTGMAACLFGSLVLLPLLLQVFMVRKSG